jgi:hypothetical protein
MAWTQNPKDNKKIETYPFIEDLLEHVHSEIDEVRERYDEDLIETLGRIYWRTFWGIKLLSGTSAQLPWLGEYMVFYVTKRHLESALSLRFVSEHETDDIWRFTLKNDSEYRLYHNFTIDVMNKSEHKLRPDVFLYKDENLLFTMDVKVGAASSENINEALTNLTQTRSKTNAQVYLVSLNPNLPFKVSKSHKCFKDFREVGGSVVGPKYFGLERKLKEMRLPLLTLRECFENISKRL